MPAVEAPVAETPIVEAPAAETPAEAVPVEETPLEESPAADAPVEAAPVEAAPAQEPAIEIVDAAGETLDMASQESAEVLAGGDPWWMVGLTKYQVLMTGQTCPSGTNGITCWTSSDPITFALKKIDDTGYIPTDRKLHVEAGTYPGFTLDGGLRYSDWMLTGILGAGSDVTTINGDVEILQNWNGFTLSGFTINGGVNIIDGGGNLLLQDLNVSNPSGKGIDIHNQWWRCSNPEGCEEWEKEYFDGPRYSGTIVLDNIHTEYNDGEAAVVRGRNSITVTNSTFNNNNVGNAAAVDTVILETWEGNVSLNGVIASGNFGGGIYIDTVGATIKNVITNDNYLDGYIPPEGWVFGYGLYVDSYSGTALFENVTANNNEDNGINVNYDGTGTLTLKNIDASDNLGNGIYLYADFGSISLTNGYASNNGKDGLIALAKTAITVNALDANYNRYDGAFLRGVGIRDWDEDLEDWIVTGYANPKVTLTNTVAPGLRNEFVGSGYCGLEINTGGAVSITNVWIDGLHGSEEEPEYAYAGIIIDNCYEVEDDWVCTGSGAVTIKSATPGGRNWITNNENGIMINSTKGNVLVDKTDVENSQDGDGIHVSALGTITLNQVSSRNNTSNGAYLDNSLAVSAKTVTVQDTRTTPDSYFNDSSGSGLFIRSKGAILLNGINANDNGASGADLDNCLESGGICAGSGSITVKHIAPFEADFNGNGEFGIRALSKGSITLQNVDANDNGIGGAFLKNSFTGSAGTINVITSGVGMENHFEGNGWNTDYSGEYEHCGDGLFVQSYGNITVKNVQAHSNQNMGTGISLYNHEALAARTVQVQNAFVSGNGSYGLAILSKGSITLKQIGANDNGYDGAWLDNHYGTAGNVTLTSMTGFWSWFNGNNIKEIADSTGLRINSNGNVSLTGFEANDNQNYSMPGLYISNETAPTAKTVKITNGTASGNWGGGMRVYARGNITLTNIGAYSNQSDGALFKNDYSGAVGKVTLLSTTDCQNVFGWNNGPGLTILSNGAVAFKDVWAESNNLTSRGIANNQTVQEYYNEWSGADQWWFTGTGALTRIDLTENGYFNYYDFYPYLSLYDEYDNLLASNDGMGTAALIEYTTTLDAAYYVLVESTAGYDGFYRLSLNDSSQDNLWEMWSEGVFINAASVTTSGTNKFNYNSLDGMLAATTGNISISGTTSAFSNGGKGLLLSNSGGGGNVTLGGYTFAGYNGWQGVYVKTNGIVSLTNLEVFDNSFSGLYVKVYDSLKAVTLKNVVAESNSGDGININAPGKITLNGIKAWFNSGHGAYLFSDNNPISILNSSFMQNEMYGLVADHGYGSFLSSYSLYVGNEIGDIYS